MGGYLTYRYPELSNVKANIYPTRKEIPSETAQDKGMPSAGQAQTARVRGQWGQPQHITNPYVFPAGRTPKAAQGVHITRRAIRLRLNDATKAAAIP